MARQWPHPLGTACTPIHPLDENQMRLVGVLKRLLRNIMKIHEGSLQDVDHPEKDATERKERSRVDAEQSFLLTTYLIKFGHFTLWRPSADADLFVKCQTEDDYDDARRVRLSTLAWVPLPRQGYGINHSQDHQQDTVLGQIH